MLVSSLIFTVMNIAVYSLYSKLMMGRTVTLNDLMHYSIVVTIATFLSAISLHMVGKRLA